MDFNWVCNSFLSLRRLVQCHSNPPRVVEPIPSHTSLHPTSSLSTPSMLHLKEGKDNIFHFYNDFMKDYDLCGLTMVEESIRFLNVIEHSQFSSRVCC